MGRVIPAATRSIAGRGRRVAALAVLALGTATCAEPPAPPASRGQAAATGQPAPPPDLIAAPDGRSWRRLAADGLHSPANDVLRYLRQPAEALGALPPGGPSGNEVDWVEALRRGDIVPRTNIHLETRVRVLDLDFVFTDMAGQPHVLLPHRAHTEWLDCANCHPQILRPGAGRTISACSTCSRARIAAAATAPWPSR